MSTAMAWAMDYDAVIFDSDGVLLEVGSGYYGDLLDEAIEETYAAFGIDPAEEDYDALRGGSPATVRAAAERHGVDPGELWREREERCTQKQVVQVEDGDRGLYGDVDALHDLSEDHTLAVVSNNRQAFIDYLAEHHFPDVFAHHYGAEPTLAGIDRRKPDPHYLEKAIDALGTENVLYVGDSVIDVKAADALGVDSAFLWRPHRDSYTLDVEPTYEIEVEEGHLRVLVDRLTER